MFFDKYQKYMKTLLASLQKHPLRYKEIVRIWLEGGAATVQLTKVMKWMKEKGYIRKQNEADRYSAYEITEAGKKYLEGLQA